MLKNLADHYIGPEGRYPGGHIEPAGAGGRVYDAAGVLQVVLEEDGGGGVTCVSAQVGAKSQHTLSPHGFETSRKGEVHREGGKQYEHGENIKRRTKEWAPEKGKHVSVKKSETASGGAQAIAQALAP